MFAEEEGPLCMRICKNEYSWPEAACSDELQGWVHAAAHGGRDGWRDVRTLASDKISGVQTRACVIISGVQHQLEPMGTPYWKHSAGVIGRAELWEMPVCASRSRSPVKPHMQSAGQKKNRQRSID